MCVYERYTECCGFLHFPDRLPCSDGTQVQDPYYDTLTSRLPGLLSLLETQESPAGLNLVTAHVTTLGAALKNGSVRASGVMSAGAAVPSTSLIVNGLLNLGGWVVIILGALWRRERRGVRNLPSSS